MAEPRAVRQTIFVRAHKSVIGAKVVNLQDEDLGKIEDLVIEAGAGRVAYAVLSFGGFLGMGDKYFAIPWNAFRLDLANSRAVLSADKNLLKNAPGFDKDNWPNITDPAWGTSISQYYGYEHYDDTTAGVRRDRS